MAPDLSNRWWVYLVECKNGAIYTGIARDVDARYKQHVAGKGAKYMRMNPPTRLVAAWQFENHRAAAQAEAAIKRLPAGKKRDWQTALSLASAPLADAERESAA